MKVVPQVIKIDSVIDSCKNSFAAWTQTRSIELIKNVEQNLPQVNVDPSRIGQVLNNLVSNAIKYTPENGAITVEAKLLSRSNEIQISVQDTGVGIPKESLEKVFDKFYQVGGRSLSDVAGTGIGLSVAKEIVEIHSGRIWVESDTGQGAKFLFTLPVAK